MKIGMSDKFGAELWGNTRGMCIVCSTLRLKGSMASHPILWTKHQTWKLL